MLRRRDPVVCRRISFEAVILFLFWIATALLVRMALQYYGACRAIIPLWHSGEARGQTGKPGVAEVTGDKLANLLSIHPSLSENILGAAAHWRYMECCCM